jgi:uncharacterized integral membrane protein
MKYIKIIFLSCFGFIIIAAALSNRQLVMLHSVFSATAIEIPLFLLMFMLVIIGIFLGAFANFIYSLRWRRKLTQAEARNKALQEEVAALKVTSHMVEFSDNNFNVKL